MHASAYLLSSLEGDRNENRDHLAAFVTGLDTAFPAVIQPLEVASMLEDQPWISVGAEWWDRPIQIRDVHPCVAVP